MFGNFLETLSISFRPPLWAFRVAPAGAGYRPATFISDSCATRTRRAFGTSNQLHGEMQEHHDPSF
jgi:hypothetical protein